MIEPQYAELPAFERLTSSLVSADSIDSDYCFEMEMMRALERYKNREARVIPVIVRDVNWKKMPFSGLQVLILPNDWIAVMLWHDKDSAWRNVAEGVEKVVEEYRKQFPR